VLELPPLPPLLVEPPLPPPSTVLGCRQPYPTSNRQLERTKALEALSIGISSWSNLLGYGEDGVVVS
jgi:hypothetical protein